MSEDSFCNITFPLNMMVLKHLVSQLYDDDDDDDDADANERLHGCETDMF